MFIFFLNVIHKATAMRVLLKHLETNLPIKPRRLIFPMRKSNFILEAMCYTSKPRTRRWRGWVCVCRVGAQMLQRSRRWGGHCFSPPNASSPARHNWRPTSADNPYPLTDVPACQTITPHCLEPSNRIWARKHIYCVFKTCMDVRRHYEDRQGRGFPPSTHLSQINVKSWRTARPRREEAVLPASPASTAQAGSVQAACRQLSASAEHSPAGKKALHSLGYTSPQWVSG